MGSTVKMEQKDWLADWLYTEHFKMHKISPYIADQYINCRLPH